MVAKTRSNARARRQANCHLANLGSRYHDAIPIDHVFALARNAGCIPIDDDGEPWQGFLVGERGYCSIPTSDPRHMLVLSWYRFAETGRYEVNAYLS